VETTDGKDTSTVTDSTSTTGRAGPVDGDQSSSTNVTTTKEGTNITTEKTSTTSSHSTGSPSKDASKTESSTLSNPPPPPVDYSHGAPSI
jgi:hypothetical protein